MKIVQKSHPGSRSITFSPTAIKLLDDLRGETPKSVFVHSVIAKEQGKHERAMFYATAAAAYTPDVGRETVRINDEIPFDEG